MRVLFGAGLQPMSGDCQEHLVTAVNPSGIHGVSESMRHKVPEMVHKDRLDLQVAVEGHNYFTLMLLREDARELRDRINDFLMLTDTSEPEDKTRFGVFVDHRNRGK